MTTQQMMVLFDETITKMRTMLEKKGHDYSQEGNRLSNFLDTANNVQIDPVQGCMYMMGIKISRLANLIANKKTPNNESIEDTAIDLIVYAFLNYCLIQDNSIILHGKTVMVDDSNKIEQPKDNNSKTYASIIALENAIKVYKRVLESCKEPLEKMFLEDIIKKYSDQLIVLYSKIRSNENTQH